MQSCEPSERTRESSEQSSSDFCENQEAGLRRQGASERSADLPCGSAAFHARQPSIQRCDAEAAKNRAGEGVWMGRERPRLSPSIEVISWPENASGHIRAVLTASFVQSSIAGITATMDEAMAPHGTGFGAPHYSNRAYSVPALVEGWGCPGQRLSRGRRSPG